MEHILIKVLGAMATFVLAFIVGMTYGGIVRKITARAHNRLGPPFYQNFIDAFKLYSKTSAIHHGAMHFLGPAFLMVSSIVSLMIVPVLIPGGDSWYNSWFSNLNSSGDLVFLIYIMTFGPLGMAMGAGQTGNPNSSIGVTRGLAQMVGFEIPWVMTSDQHPTGTDRVAEVAQQLDADLYVNIGSQPTTSAYTCRPYSPHSNEEAGGTGATWLCTAAGHRGRRPRPAAATIHAVGADQRRTPEQVRAQIH